MHLGKKFLTAIFSAIVYSMINFFESKLKQASEKFIPQFPADSNPGKERQPSWINHKTLRALKKKHNAYKRWMIT